MSTPVARLADALKVADDKNPADNERDHYLWLAHAAIEALQLTEELRVTEDGEQVAWPPSMKHARHIANHPIGDSQPVIERRLVGPWRTAGEAL